LELKRALEASKKLIAKLERKLRDKDTLYSEIPREELAQGDDIFEFQAIYTNQKKATVAEAIGLTWNEILMTVGPHMFGYIQRRPNPGDSYAFESSIEHKIRSKIIDKVGTRKLSLDPGSVDACVFHLKELGFVEFAENNSDNEHFRGITLSALGEKELSRLMISKRGPNR
jgi:hypothetical protein